MFGGNYPPPPVYGSNENFAPPQYDSTGLLPLVNVFDEFLFTSEDRQFLPPPYYQPAPPTQPPETLYDDEEGSGDDTDGEITTEKPRKRIRPSINSLGEEERAGRREKNREHAKKSRVRKKFLLDSLQQSVNRLESENAILRAAIREHLPDEAEMLLSFCAQAGTAPLADAATSSARPLDTPDFSLVKALQTTEQTFLITDPSLPDNPIVYASQGFLALTGYTLNEVLGRNCRFLQGADTDPLCIERIRHAVDKGEDVTEVILNYRADGSTFWNQLFIAGLCDTEGVVVNFLGVQCEVSESYAKAYLENHAKEAEHSESI